MKKNKSKLLIPVVVIVLVIVVLGGVLLKDSILSIFKPADAFERIEGFPKEVETTTEIEKVRTTIKSEQEFKDLIKKLFGDENKVAVPDVNFEVNDLYVVTSDLNPTKGVRVRVKDMVYIEEDKKYKVYIERDLPGSTCTFDAITNVSLDVVKINKNLPEIDSTRKDKYFDCSQKTN